MNKQTMFDRALYPDVARTWGRLTAYPWGVFRGGRRFQWFATRSDAVRFVRQVLAGEHDVTIHYFPGV